MKMMVNKFKEELMWLKKKESLTISVCKDSVAALHVHIW